jgi:cardiolipin synthase A/B
MSQWMSILITVVITYAASLIVRALTSREKKLSHCIEHAYDIADPQFLRSMENLLPPAITQGNRITPYVNGDAFFPEMLRVIASAKHSITFETFIYWQGDIGRQFAAALIDRAKAGVRVHVLLDWLGTRSLDSESIDSMKNAGIEIERYHPLRWYNLRRANNRTHRKLLVVDGTIAFTGGAGIADVWTGNAQDPEHWRDSHFKMEGPVVAQCQSAFMDNWLKTRSKVLHTGEYFPELTQQGDCLAQVFASSPAEGSESARLMYLFSIACASKSVKIANAYFVPDDLSIQTLVDARKRGVRVQVIVPGKHIDTKVTRRAGRSRWGTLLNAGVEIYEFEPTMFHCKIMVVDELWSTVGSINFDNRSFRLNDEANLNVYSGDFASGLTRTFEADLGRSRRITREAWERRPMSEKIVEKLAGLLRTQL